MSDFYKSTNQNILNKQLYLIDIILLIVKVLKDELKIEKIINKIIVKISNTTSYNIDMIKDIIKLLVYSNRSKNITILNFLINKNTNNNKNDNNYIILGEIIDKIKYVYDNRIIDEKEIKLLIYNIDEIFNKRLYLDNVVDITTTCIFIKIIINILDENNIDIDLEYKENIYRLIDRINEDILDTFFKKINKLCCVCDKV